MGLRSPAYFTLRAFGPALPICAHKQPSDTSFSQLLQISGLCVLDLGRDSHAQNRLVLGLHLRYSDNYFHRVSGEIDGPHARCLAPLCLSPSSCNIACRLWDFQSTKTRSKGLKQENP